MATSRRILWIFVSGLLAFTVGFCSSCALLPEVDDAVAYPTAPATLSEVVDALSSYSAGARITAAFALSEYGNEAVVAVPALIKNLYYAVNSDVRQAAAIALGELGPGARSAVSELIDVLQNDDVIHVRTAAAEALGKIGDACAVPVLAETLWSQEDVSVRIKAAQAIAHLADIQFPDSEWGAHGYKLTENGEPVLVITAQEWWREEGESQTWESCDS